MNDETNTDKQIKNNTKKNMKKNLYMMLIALCSIIAFSSCDDDDDNDHIAPSKELQEALNDRYPNITVAEWENKAGYYVAEFYDNGKETEVWFNSTAEWVMTETDYGKNISLLPQSVQTAFNESAYTNWIVDDIDRYERPDKTFYVIEIEYRGQRDRYLFYSEDGTLIKDVEDNGNNTILPSTPVL